MSTQREVPITEWIVRLRSSPDGKLLAYLLAVAVLGAYLRRVFYAVHAQAPGLLVCSIHGDHRGGSGGQGAAVPMLGRVAHKWGARKLLFHGGVATFRCRRCGWCRVRFRFWSRFN